MDSKKKKQICLKALSFNRYSTHRIFHPFFPHIRFFFFSFFFFRCTPIDHPSYPISIKFNIHLAAIFLFPGSSPVQFLIMACLHTKAFFPGYRTPFLIGILVWGMRFTETSSYLNVYLKLAACLVLLFF